MYCSRVNNRLPQVYRVCRPAASNTARSISLFPRFGGSDFAPMFRLIDDYANQIVNRPSFDAPSYANRVRAFNPRFDVKETSDAYELVGELPGIDQENINIEFTDPQTISIKGRTETHREEGTKPAQQAVETSKTTEQAAQLEAAAETDNASETADSEISSYHQVTVEDAVDDEATLSGETPAPAEAGPSETVAKTAPAPPAEAPAEQPQQAQPEGSRYWISERSAGQFHRSFAFPSRIDQDHVRASLKDGILSVVIPKAAVPESRRIYIE